MSVEDRAKKMFRDHPLAEKVTLNDHQWVYTFGKDSAGTVVLHRKATAVLGGREFPSWDAGR